MIPVKTIEELIKKHDLKHDVLSIFDFIKGAIEGREYAKFVFTKSLSDILSLITELGNENNLNLNDLSFCNINCLKEAYSTTEDINKILHSSIKTGKKEYLNTCSITLPPLIKNPKDIRVFIFIHIRISVHVMNLNQRAKCARTPFNHT